MACRYCKGYDEYSFPNRKDLMSFDEKLSLKGDFWPGIKLTIEGDVLRAQAVADVYEPSYIERTTKINFCPMCGRKLTA